MSVAMVVLEATAPDKAQHVQVQGAESFVVTESLQSSKRMNARSSARWIVDLRY
jgi:hypothetical protein